MYATWLQTHPMCHAQIHLPRLLKTHVASATNAQNICTIRISILDVSLQQALLPASESR